MSTDPQEVITALAESAAERFLARCLEKTGSPGNLRDCTIFKVGYVDGLAESARELTAAITTLEKQLAAQRAIVAADDRYQERLAELRYETERNGNVAMAQLGVDAGVSTCRAMREEAKRIDEVTR